MRRVISILLTIVLTAGLTFLFTANNFMFWVAVSTPKERFTQTLGTALNKFELQDAYNFEMVIKEKEKWDEEMYESEKYLNMQLMYDSDNIPEVYAALKIKEETESGMKVTVEQESYLSGTTKEVFIHTKIYGEEVEETYELKTFTSIHQALQEFSMYLDLGVTLLNFDLIKTMYIDNEEIDKDVRWNLSLKPLYYANNYTFTRIEDTHEGSLNIDVDIFTNKIKQVRMSTYYPDTKEENYTEINYKSTKNLIIQKLDGSVYYDDTDGE